MRIAFGLLVWLCLSGISVAAEPFSLSAKQQSYFDLLEQDAERQNLAEDPQWRALLHFHNRWISKESTIDSPSFFLSPDGKKELKK